MGEHPPVGSQERVEQAHPRWQVWQSDTGQWWASVRANLTPGQQRAGCVPHLTADTLDVLTEQLEAEDAKAAAAGGSR
jgi:hypothetical protein